MRLPNYFGGMILSDIETAYTYESWLVSMLKYRYEKYSKKWYFLLGMETLMKNRQYTSNDFHYIPSDPLVNIPEDILYWKCLTLKSKRLNILKLEVYKYCRRNGNLPLGTMMGVF